jgi:hypothetical protein
MAKIEGAIGRQFQSLSIAFVCAVNTTPFELEFSLQIYIELTGLVLHVPSFLHTPELLLPNIKMCLQNFLLYPIIPTMKTQNT